MTQETQPAQKPKIKRLLNDDLRGLQAKCTICSNPIASELLIRGAVVCGPGCRDKRTRLLRMIKTDDKRCRFCHKPATTSQRTAFKRFVKWEAANPELAHPQTWAVLNAGGIDLATFRAAVAEAADQDFSFDFTPHALEWRRFPKPEAPHENMDRCLDVLRAYWKSHAATA